jgi:hypothetical protein
VVAVALTDGETGAVGVSVGEGEPVGDGEPLGEGDGDGDPDGADGAGDGAAEGGFVDGDGEDEAMGTVGAVAATQGMMGAASGGSEWLRRVEWTGFTVTPGLAGAMGAVNGCLPAATGGSGVCGFSTSAPNKAPPANTARAATPAVRRAGGFGR